MQDPRSVERLRHGDVATLKRLFKANYAKLYPMAFRLTQDREAAGSVIRAAFKGLWADRAELDVFEPLDMKLVERTYAEAVAYRTENGVTGFTASGLRTDQSVPVPEIEEIADEDRLKYLLFVVDGYSFRELARAFGSSIEDVQVSVGRALTMLKEAPEVGLI
ncbi:MAG: hypothetical protein WBW88_15995 [Rhodothermales bacterium]